MYRTTRAVVAAMFGLSLVVAVPSPAQADGYLCLVHASSPRQPLNLGGGRILRGSGDQTCTGDYGRQCLEVKLQQRTGVRWWTKRSTLMECGNEPQLYTLTGLVCDTFERTRWRVKAIGWGRWGLTKGVDTSVERMACRVYPRQGHTP